MSLFSEPVESCPTCPEGWRPIYKKHCAACYEDQIDRLRTALKSIAGPDPESTLDEPDLDCEVVVKLRAIASAALSTGDQ